MPGPGWYAFHHIEGQEPRVEHCPFRMTPGQGDGFFETKLGAIQHLIGVYETERVAASKSLTRLRRMKRRWKDD